MRNYEMTVQDLIDALRSLDRDAPIRLMSQPNYPFEYSVAGVWVDESFDNDYEDDDAPSDKPTVKPVYILEGDQLGYGKRRAWDDVF